MRIRMIKVRKTSLAPPKNVNGTAFLSIVKKNNVKWLVGIKLIICAPFTLKSATTYLLLKILRSTSFQKLIPVSIIIKIISCCAIEETTKINKALYFITCFDNCLYLLYRRILHCNLLTI